MIRRIVPQPPPPAGLTTWPGEPAVRFLLRNGIRVTAAPGLAYAKDGRTTWSADNLEGLARVMGWQP